MYTILKSNANPIVGFFTSEEVDDLDDARRRAALAREWGACETKIVPSQSLAAAVATSREAVRALPDLDEKSES